MEWLFITTQHFFNDYVFTILDLFKVFLMPNFSTFILKHFFMLAIISEYIIYLRKSGIIGTETKPDLFKFSISERILKEFLVFLIEP